MAKKPKKIVLEDDFMGIDETIEVYQMLDTALIEIIQGENKVALNEFDIENIAKMILKIKEGE